MTFIEGLVIGAMAGCVIGAFLWNQYKANVAADLAKAANTVGK